MVLIPAAVYGHIQCFEGQLKYDIDVSGMRDACKTVGTCSLQGCKSSRGPTFCAQELGSSSWWPKSYCYCKDGTVLSSDGQSCKSQEQIDNEEREKHSIEINCEEDDLKKNGDDATKVQACNTGGTCSLTGCNPSRGPTFCEKELGADGPKWLTQSYCYCAKGSTMRGSSCHFDNLGEKDNVDLLELSPKERSIIMHAVFFVMRGKEFAFPNGIPTLDADGYDFDPQIASLLDQTKMNCEISQVYNVQKEENCIAKPDSEIAKYVVAMNLANYADIEKAVEDLVRYNGDNNGGDKLKEFGQRYFQAFSTGNAMTEGTCSFTPNLGGLQGPGNCTAFRGPDLFCTNVEKKCKCQGVAPQADQGPDGSRWAEYCVQSGGPVSSNIFTRYEHEMKMDGTVIYPDDDNKDCAAKATGAEHWNWHFFFQKYCVCPPGHHYQRYGKKCVESPKHWTDEL